MHKPNLKRKAPVKFEPLPLDGEKHDMLLKDIAPKEKGIKIFLDVEDEILDSRSSDRSPEAEYLKNHRRYMQETGNCEVKLVQDVIVPDEVERKVNKGIQRRKEEDEKAIKGTKKFLKKLKKSR